MEPTPSSASVPGLNSWSLAGKTALVTGATRGIGKAVAEELAALGARVYVCARSEGDLGQRLRTWQAAGLPIHGCVCDVSLPDSRERLISAVSRHFSGKLNILVNNVGTLKSMPALNVSMDEVKMILQTNFESAFHLSQLAHPLLEASKEGCIVFNSSMAGSLAFTLNVATYCSSKAALNQLTKNLAFEWARDGIRVNAVAPGYISSDLVDKHTDSKSIDAIQQRIPLRRLGDAIEVARVVAFLCMPCSSYVTGANFIVDGGIGIHNFTLPCPQIRSTL